MAYQVTGNTVITDLNAGVFANVNILSSGSLIVTSNNNLTYLQGDVGYAVYKSPTSTLFSAIARMPFANETVANDIGALTLTNDWQGGQGTAGTSGPTHGYISGTGGPSFPGLTYSRIERFLFASSTTGSGSIGNLISKQYNHGTNQSATYGYNHGGDTGNTFNPVDTKRIQKYPFAASSNATSVGSIHVSAIGVAPGGSSSSSHGYAFGGWNGNVTPYRVALISKFPFSTDSDSTIVGSMITEATGGQCSLQSETHGYACGGGNGHIQKFPFSYDAPTVVVGRMLNAGRNYNGGMSGKVNGYKPGGYDDYGSAGYTTKLDRFSFVNDAPSVDLGNFGNMVAGWGTVTYQSAS